MDDKFRKWLCDEIEEARNNYNHTRPNWDADRRHYWDQYRVLSEILAKYDRLHSDMDLELLRAERDRLISIVDELLRGQTPPAIHFYVKDMPTAPDGDEE